MTLGFSGIFGSSDNYIPSGQWDKVRNQEQITINGEATTNYNTLYTVPVGKRFWLTKVSAYTGGGDVLMRIRKNSTIISILKVYNGDTAASSFSPAILYSEGDTISVADIASSSTTTAYIYGMLDTK